MVRMVSVMPPSIINSITDSIIIITRRHFSSAESPFLAAALPPTAADAGAMSSAATNCIAECPNCKARPLVKITLNALEPKQPPQPPAVRVVPPPAASSSSHMNENEAEKPLPPERAPTRSSSRDAPPEKRTRNEKEPECRRPRCRSLSRSSSPEASPVKKKKTQDDAPPKTKKGEEDPQAEARVTNDEDDSTSESAESGKTDADGQHPRTWECAGCKEKTRYREMYQSRTNQWYCEKCAQERELATAPPRRIQ